MTIASTSTSEMRFRINDSSMHSDSCWDSVHRVLNKLRQLPPLVTPNEVSRASQRSSSRPVHRF